MTPKTSRSVTVASTGLTRVPQPADTSSTHLESRFSDPDYWRAYFSLPAYDLAEAVVRLRRTRGLSQEDLAVEAGMHQPSIARLESGEGNPRLSTLVEVAKGLDACVRVQLVPFEQLKAELRIQLWYFWRPGAAIGESVQNVSVHDGRSSLKAIASVIQNTSIVLGTLEDEQARGPANNNFALAG